jgi:hypothetical protein
MYALCPPISRKPIATVGLDEGLLCAHPIANAALFQCTDPAPRILPVRRPGDSLASCSSSLFCNPCTANQTSSSASRHGPEQQITRLLLRGYMNL